VARSAAAALAVLGLLGGGAVDARAEERAPGLRDLRRVTVDVSLPGDLAGAGPDIAERVDRTLRAPPPVLARDGTSADTLRVVATVRAESATRLRGFWLPFSGTYAVGSVRLEVERPMRLPGATAAGAPVPAIVWRRDRVVASPWPRAAAEIGAAVEELTRALLQECRRAGGG
jgi:hypothetical protein